MKSSRHILITGASGFVGNHLVEKALADEYVVHALVRKASKQFQRKNVQYHYADITSYDQVYAVLKFLKDNAIEPEYIIHAAALAKSNSLAEIEKVNYSGTGVLYQCLKQLNYNPKKVIFISSLAAAGPEVWGKQIAGNSEKPVTTYGKSKLAAEKITQGFLINTVIIRPTAVYGPGDRDLYSVFKLIKNNFNPLLGSHPQQLTFIYVKDLVNIIFSALEFGEARHTYVATDGGVYDKKEFPKVIAGLLNKKPVTVTFPLSVVKMIAFFSQYLGAMIGKTSSLNREKYKELIAGSWMCDAEHTFKTLRYQPEYNLSRGVEETVKWYKQNKWI